MTYRDEVRRQYRIARKKGCKAIHAIMTARFEAKYGRHSPKRRVLPNVFEAYDGEEIHELPNGWKVWFKFQRDDDFDPPWKNCDGMGVVEESRSHPGDSYRNWILNSDHGWYRYYDWKATLREAIHDWGCTDREHAMAAMKSTYEYLRRWCNDQWWYVGLIVTLLDEQGKKIESESCWGYESDAMSTITSEMRGWAADMIRKWRRTERAARHNAHVERRFFDAMENAL